MITATDTAKLSIPMAVFGLVWALVQAWLSADNPTPAPIPEPVPVVVPAFPPGPAFVIDASGKSIDAPAIIEAAKAPGSYTVHLPDSSPRQVVVGGGPAPSPLPTPPRPEPPKPGPTVPSVPVAPVLKPTAATYVYEKDQTALLPEIMSGLNRVNRELGIVATTYEADITDGTGDVPEQYREALTAARSKGLPCLVVMAGKAVVSITNPKTAAEVWEACK